MVQRETIMLHRKHPEVLKELEVTISAVQSEETSVGSLRPDPQTMKWKATNTRQVKLTDSIVNFIANDLLPLSIVDRKDFRNILSLAEPCFTMPSRKHISQTLIPQRTASVQDHLRSQMQQTQDICLTIDLWSSRDMRSFFGITGHFIQDYALQSVMLACRHS
ncbi:UNVERIFIED_CONTAM: hypothetical protein FKN15_015602 [Acipenser sinensis]